MENDTSKANVAPSIGEVYPILKYFEYAHLPEHLRVVSVRFAVLAYSLVDGVPSDPERAAGLRKLLEAKDCFVRARAYEVKP